ncbi:MAG: hypothetical protein QOH08_140 [Chloroflexota bacterium]|jgi:hypothetical protein|nr:hypothetical protein [Chloroflexota bacterium]
MDPGTPRDLDQPFAIWSVATLASYLGAEGVVRDILNAATTKVMFVDGYVIVDRPWLGDPAPLPRGVEEQARAVAKRLPD